MPNDCVAQENCNTVVTGVVLDGRYQFELKTRVSNAVFVSFAFSTDIVMGNDASMDCIQEGGIIGAYSSWLLPRPNLGATRDGVVSSFADINLFFIFYLLHKSTLEVARKS